MTSITANLENVGVYLTRSSPVLSEYHYESVTESSSMLCILESDGSHSVSCHTLFQTWQPYLPDNCLKLGGASKLSMDSDIVLPPVRLLTDFIPNGGSAGSQQLFSVSKTAQDLIDDYLEQETNPSRPVTVYPKRKTKINQESQPDIDVTPSSHKSSIHILDHSIDSSPKCNVSESKAVDAATILPTDHYRAEARTTQNEASKNRGHVKAKAAASSSKSITHRDQSRSYVPRCHKHTWVSNSRSQPFLDQSDSTGCSSLDVTAAAKSLGEALAAKLQSLLYSGTSNHKCNCECSCQPSVGEESGTSRNKLMNDKQNGKNNCPGALCYKSPSHKSCFDPTLKTPTEENNSNAKNHPLCKPPCMELTCGERSKCNEQLNKNTPTKENNSYAQNHPLCKPPCRELTCGERSKCNEQLNKKTPTKENNSNAQNHPLCKPPCRELTCGERSKCNEQLNKKTPTEVNTSEAASPAETKTPPLVPPLLKGYCTDSENCKVKTPDFQARVASSATIVLKSPCLGPGKCINNESLDPQTKCPGGCQARMSRNIILPNSKTEIYTSKDIVQNQQHIYSDSKTKVEASIWKRSCPGFEKFKPKTPPLTRCPGGCKDKDFELSRQSSISKDSCPGLEKCKHKTPPLTSCPGGCKVKNSEPDSPKPAAQSPIRKNSFPGCEKCKPKTPPLTRCPGCKVKNSEPGLPEPPAQCRPYRSGGYEIPTPRQATPEPQATSRKISSPEPRSSTLSSKINQSIQADLPNDKPAKYGKDHEGSPAFKTFEQQCPPISPSVVSLSSRRPPSQVTASPTGRSKGLKIEVKMRKVGTGSHLPNPALSFPSTGIRQKENTSNNLRNIGVGPDRPLGDTKKSSVSEPAKSTQGTNTRPEITGDDYMPKETRCLAACEPASGPAKDIISGIKLEQVEKPPLSNTNATKSVDTVNCGACVTCAKSFEERHTNTEQSKSSTATGPGPCCGDQGLTIIQQRGTDPGPELESGEIDESNSCYVIFKRTKTGLLRPCCAYEGLRKFKEKTCSCTGKSSDNVSNRPIIKSTRSVAHKKSTAIKTSTLRSCCSWPGEVQGASKIQNPDPGLDTPTRSAALNTSQCAIIPDPVKCCKTVETQMNTPQYTIVQDPVNTKCCKTVETQMNTPQCVNVPAPVNTKRCKTIETQISEKCNIPRKKAAKRKNTILNKCKGFYAKCRYFGCRSKTCPGKIPSKKESNCDKPLCPSNQNPATIDTCPYGLILGDQSQAIKIQQEVLNRCFGCGSKTCPGKILSKTKSNCDKSLCPSNQNPATSDTCPYGLILGDQSQAIKSQQEVLNRSFGCGSKTCPGKILSKKKSNCDKSLCPSNQNPATSDTCPYGLILGDQSQAIKSQQEVLNLQGSPESREKPYCSKLVKETQPRSQAQNINTQMSDSAPLCSKKIGHNKNKLLSNSTSMQRFINPSLPFTSSQTNKRTKTSKSQTTSVESCKNPCCPFKGLQISDNQTSIDSCGNPEFRLKDSQASEIQTTSIDSCGSPNCPFRDSQTDRDQTTSIESCANPDCPFKDSQTDENQTTSVESCDNSCCPYRESQANIKTSSTPRWSSLCPYHDTLFNNNQPATLFCTRQPTNSSVGPCCRVKDPQIQNSATSRRTLETSQNNVQLYNNKKTHWAKSCCGNNTSRSKPENMQANSISNSKANTQCACCSRYMIPANMQRSPTNCRSVCCFEILQTNEHPPCINSYPSADSQAYQSNEDKRDDEKCCNDKYRTQETQTRSLETHYKSVLPYLSKLSSRTGLCLKLRPVAQRTLKYFSPPLPSRPQKVKDYPSNPQELGDYLSSPTSPQELQRYLVSQQCDPSTPQDGASHPQGTQGYLTTPGCDPKCPQGYSACAQDVPSHLQGTQGYLITPGGDPECPQGYSGCDQVGASHLQGTPGYPITPRCDPDCPQHCQRSVGPPYTKRDANSPALLSRSFAQTEYPYEEIKPENRTKQKKISGNLTKSKEVQGIDYPCAEVCQDDGVPSGSAESLNSFESAGSLKSVNSAKYVKPKKVKSRKSPKSKKQSRKVGIPCVDMSQQKITPCGSYSSLEISGMGSTDGSKKLSNSAKQPKVLIQPPKTPKASKAPVKSNQATSPCPICLQKLMSSDNSSSLISTSVKSSKVKSPKPAKVKSPKSAKVSKPAKSVEFPCGVCQQKLMSSDSSSGLVISATSVKSTRPAPKSAEFPCGICQQKLMSSESSINSISATSVKSSKGKRPSTISPGESPKPIRRTVVKLKDPGSYKPDQKGVISVEQYEKNKRKKKKTKQLTTDVCLPICGQDEKNKKERLQVVDCVKGSRLVKASIITCQCPEPEPPKKRGAFACALDTLCKCRKPVPHTPQVTAYALASTVNKGPNERVVPCVYRTPGSYKFLKKPASCHCPPPEPGSQPSSCKQRPDLCETPANQGLKVQVHRKGPAGLAEWCPLLKKC